MIIINTLHSSDASPTREQPSIGHGVIGQDGGPLEAELQVRAPCRADFRASALCGHAQRDLDVLGGGGQTWGVPSARRELP